MYNVKIVETAKEHEDAFAVRKQVFVEEQGVPLHLECDAEDASATHFIMYEDNDPVGAARLRNIVDDAAKIERVCILQDQRGKKLGALIMKEMEKYAISINKKKLKLHAQSYAIPFYEKLGYAVTSPEFMDAGIPHRAMEKTI
ncbi:GNAT family N-acetyltransferase [Lysinibacillus sp. KCTC 33748]|uniref:GNAT family N-acetyltransferase n=1 Tax=unclassified Lysinibacillus TaxID=2636778 RepID=UPI0009A8FF2A|nr:MULTISPECIES: GNAT family N-acetyltransferase [unclassified Lysinibacillus]OXS77121.1 GNAT family N-acetyltransferase [Lysinibacillus sp. KCTC 33748]SKB30304.1 Predicted N-acyltransferase, GNAT family [Lysinibacillus sp. AC-3]